MIEPNSWSFSEISGFQQTPFPSTTTQMILCWRMGEMIITLSVLIRLTFLQARSKLINQGNFRQFKEIDWLERIGLIVHFIINWRNGIVIVVVLGKSKIRTVRTSSSGTVIETPLDSVILKEFIYICSHPRLINGGFTVSTKRAKHVIQVLRNAALRKRWTLLVLWKQFTCADIVVCGIRVMHRTKES